VTFVNQKLALALGALAGAAAAVLFRRRRPPVIPAASPPADPRAQELREKLDEARSAAVDEAEFDAAGMGAETIVTEEPRHEPVPSDEFEAMRRRVHEEARAAADQMRRAEAPDSS
jgi:membrane-bound lytic murein transglycosylase B